MLLQYSLNNTVSDFRITVLLRKFVSSRLSSAERPTVNIQLLLQYSLNNTVSVFRRTVLLRKHIVDRKCSSDLPDMDLRISILMLILIGKLKYTSRLHMGSFTNYVDKQGEGGRLIKCQRYYITWFCE